MELKHTRASGLPEQRLSASQGQNSGYLQLCSRERIVSVGLAHMGASLAQVQPRGRQNQLQDVEPTVETLV